MNDDDIMAEEALLNSLCAWCGAPFGDHKRGSNRCPGKVVEICQRFIPLEPGPAGNATNDNYPSG